MAKISKNIKRLRTERGLSQDDLAKMLFISRQAVSSWEVGRTQPDIEMIGKLSDVFNIPTEELLYGAKRDTSLEDGVKAKKKMTVIFSVIGCLFVGIGLSIIIAGLWDKFPGMVKSIVALIPILVGQAGAFFVYKKKFDNVAWREGGAILWAVGVIATVGLMSMVNDLFLGVTTCLFIDAILILPIIYFFKVFTPLVFYYGFALTGVIGFMDEVIYVKLNSNITDVISMPVFTISCGILVAWGAAIVYFNRRDLSENALDYCRWVTALAALAIMFYDCIFFEALGLIPISLGLMYAIAKRDTWLQPFYPVAVLGIPAISLIYTVFCLESYDVEYMESVYNANFFASLITAAVLIAVGIGLFCKNLKGNAYKIVLCSAAVAEGVLMLLSEIQFINRLNGVLIFVITFIIGVDLIVKGAIEKSYFSMNIGIITLLVLVFLILTIIDLNLITVGFMFLLSGGSLLGANVFISKQIKKDQEKISLKEADDVE